MGVNKGSDFIGQTDFSFYPEENATFFRLNDRTALEKKAPITVVENVRFLSGISYTALTYKRPLQGQGRKLLGVLGLSFILQKTSTLLNLFDQINLIIPPALAKKIKVLSYDRTDKLPEKELTKRQIDCLYHLVLGKTAKEIAIILSLSNRTVEHHIELIKDKYHCTSRSQLIEMALQLQPIKEKLLIKLL